jgi:hypothetical protein
MNFCVLFYSEVGEGNMIDKKLYYKSSSSLGATALGEPLSP